MTIVIIGASFAGLSAALECLALYPEAKIVLIDKEEDLGYFPNALNWRLKGLINDWSEARNQLYHQVMHEKVEWLLGWELTSIQSTDKNIEIKCQAKRQKVAYDYLILAMGARQVWDKQSSNFSSKTLTSKSLSQMEESMEKILDAQSITVIGAGQIGLESLDALSRHDVKLRLIEAQKWPLAKYFDKEMTDWLYPELISRGIEVHFSETVNQIHLGATGQLVFETIQNRYMSDYMVMGTNFTPNTEILDGVLSLQLDGSLIVDDYLQTSEEFIFAVGDLIRMPVAFFGQSYLPMINHAILTGRLVAHNLLEKKRKLDKVERIVSSHVFGYNMTSVGMTEREASIWLDTRTVRIQQTYSQKYSQWEDDPIDFKLIIEKQGGRLLGGQLVSQFDHTAQMDVLALAIAQELTVDDLFTQSWLCLPGRTEMVPFLLEAVRQYILQEECGE